MTTYLPEEVVLPEGGVPTAGQYLFYYTEPTLNTKNREHSNTPQAILYRSALRRRYNYVQHSATSGGSVSVPGN